MKKKEFYGKSIVEEFIKWKLKDNKRKSRAIERRNREVNGRWIPFNETQKSDLPFPIKQMGWKFVTVKPKKLKTKVKVSKELRFLTI